MQEAEIINMLRGVIPVEGNGWTYLWVLDVQPGSEVYPHEHPGWTAVVHEPQESAPPVEVVVGDDHIFPGPWEPVVIPPHTNHYVPTWEGERPRRSYALTVIPGDNRKVVKSVVR